MILIGERFKRWTVVGSVEFFNRLPVVDCRCECGSVKKVNVYTLKNGKTGSCGCLRREVSHKKAKGKVKKPEDRSMIFGFGINDSALAVTSRDNQLVRSIYMKWILMINRCYAEREGKSWGNMSMYRGCSIVNEWSLFSAFYSWAESRYFDGCELDKDLLVPGNRIYGPDTCCFLPREINNFIRITSAGHYDSSLGRFRAVCNNPFTKKRESLGLFGSMDEAKSAWRARKHQLSCDYANTQTDPIIAEALRARYK